MPEPYKPVKLNAQETAYVYACIEAGREFQDEAWANPADASIITLKDRPARHKALLSGRYWEEVDRAAAIESDSILPPRRTSNQLLPKCRIVHGKLTGGETTILCDAKRQALEQIESQAGAYLTQCWRVYQVDRARAKALWDTFCYPFGVVRVGWRFETEEAALEGERGEPVVPEDAEPMLMDGEGGLVFAETVEEYESQAAAEAAAMEQNAAADQAFAGMPLVDEPYFERVSPADLLIDPNAANWDLSDARFVFLRRWIRLGELKASKRLKHTDELKGTEFTFRPKSDGSDTARSVAPEAQLDDERLCEVFDGYVRLDRDKDGRYEIYHLMISQEAKKPLLCQPYEYVDERGRPMFTHGNPFPFRVIPGIPTDNDDPYPQAHLESAVDLQLAYDEQYHAALEYCRKGRGLYEAVRGQLDDAAKEVLEEGEVGSVVEMDTLGLLQPLTRAGLSKDELVLLQGIPTEIDVQLGVTKWEQNSQPGRRMTATEAENIQTQGETRTSGLGDIYREYGVDLAQCLLALLQAFQVVPQEFSQRNAVDGSRDWGQMNFEQLRPGEDEPFGEQFNVKLDVDTEPARSLAQEKMATSQLLQALVPLMQMPDQWTGQPVLNIRPLLTRLVRAWGIDDPALVVTPEPSEQDKVSMLLVQMRQMEQIIAQLKAAVQGQGQMSPPGSSGQQGAGGGPPPLSPAPPPPEQAMMGGNGQGGGF
jgi:hypothetical protein